ncbi:hypothetical protein D3C76_1521300 [compost metagenome]
MRDLVVRLDAVGVDRRAHGADLGPAVARLGEYRVQVCILNRQIFAQPNSDAPIQFAGLRLACAY